TTRLPLKGFQYLLYAAEAHSRLKLDKLTAQQSNWYWGDSVEQAVVRLASVPVGEPANDDEEQLRIRQLQTFPTKTLERLLPVAECSRHLIYKALGWENTVPLIEL